MSALDSQLYRALHRYRKSDVRWAELRTNGASDEELRQRIGDEFGSHAGFGGPGDDGASFDGGPHPRFWIGSPAVGKPALEGQALVDAVRRVMRIPRPKTEPDQQTLFAEGT